jgi:peroxiredoxin Q/BCP
MNVLDWIGITRARQPLEVGDAAPDVEVRDETGALLQLADAYDEGFTLVYFYPKADTPGCTAQACSIRNDFAQLQSCGVRVLGVSSDVPEAQLRFKEKYRLPFTLLADTEHAVARAFGVRLLLGMTHRETFLIRNGRVVWRDFNPSTTQQAQDVLRAIEKAGVV